jgi:hypothetical protein
MAAELILRGAGQDCRQSDCLCQTIHAYPFTGPGRNDHRLKSLRIVRLLPACAQLFELVESDGQGLGNPRGRKPRERADRSAEAVRYGDLSGDIDV